MNRSWLGLFLISFAFNACNSFQPAKTLETPYPVVDDSGNSRDYRLFLPATRYGKLPLLVYFHGVISPGFKNIPSLKKYTGSPIEETSLIQFCRNRGIILLVPTARYEYTFLGCSAVGWQIDKEVDGIEKIIDTVIAHYTVDPRRVFLAGLSAGAGMSHYLANRRPHFYNAIISHSQAYVNQKGENLPPVVKGPQFGVVYCYNLGDYPDLIRICIDSERIYRQNGYRTILLRDLPPRGHAWSSSNNGRFWKLMNRLGRQN
ncbi:MAG: prolyl oligopeptidase family serine peptidase [Candidatus Aminicenantes bacterium]|nr:prolyl oligopeptidase family serine peptidase [Candidatus Aminicenantes bacterium]